VSAPEFDFDAVFDPDDYLYFYGPRLTPERTAREAELIGRVLALEPGMAVLDLACGHGRIANVLAERGCRVVGLDATPGFLELARREAAGLAERGIVAPEYVLGDMRHLPWTERFDRIVNWFTAYGYFDDEGNRDVLREAQRVLKPGGKLLIELNNRDFVLRTFQQALVVERDGNYLIDQSRYDVPTGRMLTERTLVRDGRVRRMRFFTRMFTFPELRDWLLAAGFTSAEGFDERGEPFALESRRMLIVATK
jgi:SAM-dependent methyltransferase